MTSYQPLSTSTFQLTARTDAYCFKNDVYIQRLKHKSCCNEWISWRYWVWNFKKTVNIKNKLFVQHEKSSHLLASTIRNMRRFSGSGCGENTSIVHLKSEKCYKSSLTPQLGNEKCSMGWSSGYCGCLYAAFHTWMVSYTLQFDLVCFF